MWPELALELCDNLFEGGEIAMETVDQNHDGAWLIRQTARLACDLPEPPRLSDRPDAALEEKAKRAEWVSTDPACR